MDKGRNNNPRTLVYSDVLLLEDKEDWGGNVGGTK
jgi:hypothetical protein